MKVLVFYGNEFNQAYTFGPYYDIEDMEDRWRAHFAENDIGADIPKNAFSPAEIFDYVDGMPLGPHVEP
jgi:hypothetical protein